MDTSFWTGDPETINNKLCTDFQTMENSIKPRHDKYIRWYRLYNGIILPEEKRDNGANLFINYTKRTIDALISRCLQALFRQKPYVVISPQDESHIEQAKLMQSLIEHQLDNRINIVGKWWNILLETFLYGTSIPFTDWKLEKKAVKKWQDITIPLTSIKIGRLPVSMDSVVYDAPTYETTDIFNVFVMPYATDIKSADPICIRTYITPEEFKDRIQQGIYKNTQDINDESWPLTDIEKVRLEKQEITDKGNTNRVKVKTFYYDDRIVTQINDMYIVQNEENPNFSMEKPFDRVMWHPMPNEFWGSSLVEQIESLQLELNTTRNQRIDNVSLVLNKVFGYNKNSDIDPNTIISRPGHCIPMNSPEDIWDIPIPDVTQSAYEEEQIIKQDIQYITLVNDYSMGATTSGAADETATAVRNKTDSANVNFNTVVMMLNNTGLMPLYDKMVKLNMQYMMRPENIRIDTQEGSTAKQVTQDMISGDYGLIPANPNFELPISKETKRQDLVALIGIISKVPQMAQLINYQAYLKKLLELYDIKDSDQIMQNPQAMQAMQGITPGIPMQGTNTGTIPQEVEQSGYG